MAITRMVIEREEDDPLCLRASIGGSEEDGYYLIFRGDPEKVSSMLNRVATAANVALPGGQYIDKRGRPQG